MENKPTNVARDNANRAISAPVLRKIVMSGITFTTDDDITVILGSDVSITIQGVTIDMLQGVSFILVHNVTYTFSVDTALGIS